MSGHTLKKRAKKIPPMTGEVASVYLAQLQRAADFVEQARAAHWLDGDPAVALELCDEAIDLLIALGVERRERDYNNEANPSGVPE